MLTSAERLKRWTEAKREPGVQYERALLSLVQTDHPTAQRGGLPERECVQIFLNRDGSLSYYRTDVSFILKYQARYGEYPQVSWVYPEHVPTGVEVVS